MADAIPKIIRSTFQLKRGNSADWASQDPVLLEGEPGFELDTGKLKVGDGVSTWEELNSVSGASASYDSNSFIEENNGSVRLTIGDNYIDAVPQNIYNNSLISNLTDNQAVNYYKATAEITGLAEHTPIYLDSLGLTKELFTSDHPSTIPVENYSEVTFATDEEISAEILSSFKINKNEDINLYPIEGNSTTNDTELSNGSIWHIQNVNNKNIELVVDSNLPISENWLYDKLINDFKLEGMDKKAIQDAAKDSEDPHHSEALLIKNIITLYLNSISFSNIKTEYHDQIFRRLFPIITQETTNNDPNTDLINWGTGGNEDIKIDSSKPAGFCLVIPGSLMSSEDPGTQLAGLFDTTFPETTLAGLQSTSVTSNYLYTNLSDDDISSWLGQTVFPKENNEEPSFIFEYNSTNSNVNIISDEDFSNNYITLYWNKEVTKHKVLPDTSFETDNFIKIENGTIGLTLGDSVVNTETGETNTIKLPSSYIETIDTVDTSSNIPTAAAVKSAIDNITIETVNSSSDIITGSDNIPTAGAVADALANIIITTSSIVQSGDSNPVTSNAVYQAINDAIANAIGGSY